MVIKILDDGKYQTLKFSKLAPFEYVICAKDEFAEPMKGIAKTTGKPWQKFKLRIYEFKTVDENGDKELFKDETGKQASYFANTEKLAEKLTAFPVNVKFKIFAVIGKGNDGKAFTEYKAEALDKVATKVTNKSPTPGVELDEKIKAFKKAGIKSVHDVLSVLTAEYDVPDEFVKMRWDEL
jgi:hypothetical protein